jgi:hypothetical protein
MCVMAHCRATDVRASPGHVCDGIRCVLRRARIPVLKMLHAIMTQDTNETSEIFVQSNHML